MEVLLPWQNLDSAPRLGETIGFGLWVNDVGGPRGGLPGNLAAAGSCRPAGAGLAQSALVSDGQPAGADGFAGRAFGGRA